MNSEMFISEWRLNKFAQSLILLIGLLCVLPDIQSAIVGHLDTVELCNTYENILSKVR